MTASILVSKPLPGAAFGADRAAREIDRRRIAPWPAGRAGRRRRPPAHSGPGGDHGATRTLGEAQLSVRARGRGLPHLAHACGDGARDGARDLHGHQHGAGRTSAAKQPDPPLTAAGKLPVQYPHRTGWHTDQSYRRPPPDVSLFYAVTPVARERGQTIFASGHLAYEALPPDLKAKVETLEGLHAQLGSGRGRSDAEAGKMARRSCRISVRSGSRWCASTR